MARASYFQRTEQIARFLVSVREPTILRALVAAGFSDAEYEEGWRRLRAIGPRTLAIGAENRREQVIGELFTLSRRWFLIAEAALRHHHPEAAESFFKGLAPVRGPAAVIAVQLFLNRLVALESELPEARALLQARGVDDALVAHLGSLDTYVQTMSAGDAIDVDDKAVERAWAWYVEWTTIARTTVEDRVKLRTALGTGRKKKKTAAGNATVGEENRAKEGT